MQVIADPHGKLLWASPALPGAVDDIKAARTHGIGDALSQGAPGLLGGQGLPGRGRHTVRVPFRGRWDWLSAGQCAVTPRTPASVPSASRPWRP
jgi:hypothetical protein